MDARTQEYLYWRKRYARTREYLDWRKRLEQRATPANLTNLTTPKSTLPTHPGVAELISDWRRERNGLRAWVRDELRWL